MSGNGKILAISGSLRADSSSRQILRFLQSLPAPGYDFSFYDSMDSLPHFNDPTSDPPAVTALKQILADASGVVICTPEYAFGVPGSLKNMLDWTVGSGDLVNKPVALITASSSGDKAHASLLATLTALSASVAADHTLLIPFIRSKLDVNGHVKDPALSNALMQCWNSFLDHLNASEL
ncbi:NADPH-dependent FMN reductase [Sediminibacterium ginsengisoli]|uniref:NAD(P)H-dependent FMN reductase n=1 Tax=Sediminibacterium ginsengisoli TaxID=413434 RepID=A0A1T4QIA0_9BACT|nr:NAD(P)H-dependent oxidoreductase [Sediminibacterium ginsengisoli]SKA03455.1 NAD(P)H-dependent FMN reductase [Sediminibacterium ginsengisoli]